MVENKTIKAKLLHNGQGKIKCPVCSEVMRLYQHDKDELDIQLFYVCNQCNSIIATEAYTGGKYPEIEVEII